MPPAYPEFSKNRRKPGPVNRPPGIPRDVTSARPARRMPPPPEAISTAAPATARGKPRAGRGPKPIGTGGPAPQDVDENLLVRRYVLARWPVAACARAAKITSKRARDILLAHHVQLREKPPLDEEEIIAAYQRQRSMHAVAVAFATSDSKVSAILAAHGIQPAPRPRPLPLTPSLIQEPGDRVTLTEAARVLGRSSKAVKQAVSDGLIRTGHGPRGATRYIRSDVEALAAQLREGEPPGRARRESAAPPAQPPAAPAPA